VDRVFSGDSVSGDWFGPVTGAISVGRSGSLPLGKTACGSNGDLAVVLEQRECLQVDAERLAELLGVVGMGGLPGVSAINCRVAESTVCIDRLPGSGLSGVAVGRASRV
jgi:hypothetical protein